MKGFVVFASVFHLFALTGTAQTPARPAYTANAGRQVIDSMAVTLRARYADADTGAMIAAHIQRRLAGGAYERVTSWDQFVRVVTQDLQSVNEDTHLLLQLSGPSAPGGPAGPGAGGHGLDAVEHLDGNVGYMRLTNFLPAAGMIEALEGALRTLSTTGAIIIDIRNSRGGSPGVANFIISHFTGPDTSLSLLVYDRVRNTTTPRYTLRDVPGPRRTDVPLFVLTDDVTRSAAEDFAFVLQNMKRATIVGSRTAGAGRNVAGFPVGHGIIGSVSFTRVMEPGTRREWERTGIVPDVRVHPDSALAVAHREAIRRMVASASGESRQQLALVLQRVEAKYTIAAQAAARLVPAPELARYVGTYEGGQTIVIAGDRLVYQPRIAQPRETLSPVENATFSSGSTRFRFSVTGDTATMTLVNADGSSTTFPRVSRTVAPRRQ